MKVGFSGIQLPKSLRLGINANKCKLMFIETFKRQSILSDKEFIVCIKQWG